MLSRRDWLRHHLQANHFPPLPSAYLNAAERAVECCMSGEPRAPVELPGGVEVAAGEYVRATHLDGFLDAGPAE